MVFPYHLFKRDKIIVLYGADRIGQAYYPQLTDSGFCRKVKWVDRQYSKISSMRMHVQDPKIIFRENFDYIVIAVKDKIAQKDISKWLIEQKVDSEKIHCYSMGTEEN